MAERSHRIDCLDSLRGLAALSVVFLHVLSVYGAIDLLRGDGEVGSLTAFLLSRTPLGILYAGAEAVILFFTLSGFVLALPFLSDRTPSYPAFLTRRVCRIYLPYAAALFIAIVARSAVTIEPVAGATPWFEMFWTAPPTLGTVAGYLAMTGFSYHTAIDFVVWSLIHEMRISLIFPLLMAMTARGRLEIRLGIAAAFSIACAVANLRITGTSTLHFVLGSLLDTGSYIWFFVVGIELARYRRVIARWVAARSHAEVSALFAAAVCFYGVRYPFPELVRTLELDFITGLGAAGFIALAIGRAGFNRWLTGAPLLFLGRVSYSLYLFHPIVLLTAVYAMHGRVNTVILLAAAVPLSIGAAALAWALIEKPSTELGRMLTRRTAELHPSRSRLGCSNIRSERRR